MLSVPDEKHLRVVNMLTLFISKRKATIKDMQRLAGYLNFLNRAIFPGRTFTRRMYAKFKATAQNLKSYHHIKLDNEFKDDCRTWLEFLNDKNGKISKAVCRPWVDLTENKQAPELDFYTDSSGSTTHGGCGGVFGKAWFAAEWSQSLMEEKEPSITYLELFALVMAITIWHKKLRNSRFTMFCDNQAVVEMVNKLTSGCKNCMKLLHILVWLALEENFRVFAKYVKTQDNGRAYALSRGDKAKFLSNCEKMGVTPNSCSEKLLENLWPPENLWLD